MIFNVHVCVYVFIDHTLACAYTCTYVKSQHNPRLSYSLQECGLIVLTDFLPKTVPFVMIFYYNEE